MDGCTCSVYVTVVVVSNIHQLLRLHTDAIVNIKVPCRTYWVGDNYVTCTTVRIKGYLLIVSKAYYCAEHGEKQNYSEQNLSQCYFAHHESHMDHPRMETKPPPQAEAGY
jgi:hypothetical protein